MRIRSLSVSSAVAMLAASAVLAGAVMATNGAPAAPAAAPAGPNVLVIVTDDERPEGLEVMPATRAFFAKGGTTFDPAYTTTPNCCPSRSSIFSGRYSHNHGVYTNRHTGDLDHAKTMQAELKGAGYQTGIAGKFLLYWDLQQPPPHFDHYAIVNETDYYGDRFAVDGERKKIDQYSTDYIRDRALEYLDRFEADDTRPWFMYLATQAPHDPFIPAERHQDAPVPPWEPGPAVEEEDRSDKPDWVATHGVRREEAAEERTAQLRTLMAVDEMVEAVTRRMAELGEDDTLAVFTSDNGYFWGEHRNKSKALPYTPGIRVPLLVRWPGRVPAGAVDGRAAAGIDIAPTVRTAAGIPPSYTVDGMSLLGDERRGDLLTEFTKDPGWRYPTWASLRDSARQYVEWYDDDGSVVFRDYYDLVADPGQLENLLADGDPANDPDVRADSAKLAKARSCAGRAGGGTANPCP
ncbi:MAG: sulfatase family protein [Acidimicrobiia bacterium]